MSGAILAIRLRALGDVVLTTPALRALHRGALEAPIDVVTNAPYAGILRGLPGVDRVLGLERGGMRRLLAELRTRRYARAIDFFGNPRSAVLCAASRAPDASRTSTTARIESPTCSGLALSSPGSSAMRTGTRCATFTQLPEAFCGGSSAKALPVPGDRPAMRPWNSTSRP